MDTNADKWADIGDIQKREEIDSSYNPLALLGVEAWILRSIPQQALVKFLRDFKKLAAKYFHPDVCHDELRRQAHEYYFKRLTGAVDRLLQDEFYMMSCLDDLANGSSERMRHRIAKLEHELRLCREEHASTGPRPKSRDRADADP